MMRSSWLRGPRFTLALACGGAAACGESGPTAPPPPDISQTVIDLESDVGDFIGLGQSFRYTQADAAISVTANQRRISVVVSGDENWTGEFEVPAGESGITVGSYENVERFPASDPTAGGLSWTGESRGCGQLTGRFTVHGIHVQEGQLRALDLSFQQNCEGSPAALRGTIRWTIDDPTVPPGPQNPPPNLWAPPPGSVPATGNFVYLDSDADDYIGAGLTYTYAGAEVSVSGQDRRLSVQVGGWTADFVGMNVIDVLQTGYYPGLLRYPFHNAVKGGLDWSGNGRGCNELEGWFVIDEIGFLGATVTSVELRFQQRCERGSSALHGYVRWSG